MIEKRTYARIGLMGNPSDGFYGKTLSSCITNFYATATLTENHRLEIVPHQICDTPDCLSFYPSKGFCDLQEVETVSNRNDYSGGLRLVYATCKRFSNYCRDNGIKLGSKVCRITYDTTIPRQVGLGGSSGIIVSLVKALMDFYCLTSEDIPLEIQPNLVLSVETEELGINAGLQDRVVQTYGGTVFMDFSKRNMDSLGHGFYERMDPSLLPDLFLACIESPGKDSGKMHNKTRARFSRGDEEIIDAMVEFASFAKEAKLALENGDHGRFGELMNMNFDLRRKIYGDDAIGEKNLQMIEIARSHGAPVKFPGSGGAVVGMYDSEEQFDRLRTSYLNQGLRFAKAIPLSSDFPV